MKRKLLFAAAGFVLTSCAYHAALAVPGDGKTNRCGFGAGNCEVKVTVKPGSGGSACSISADLPTIYVGKGTAANPTTTIRWTMQTAGYSFVQPVGVLFDKKNRQPPAGTFTVSQATGPSVLLVDRNPDNGSGKGVGFGTWPYSIYVAGNNDACRWDPDVDNN